MSRLSSRRPRAGLAALLLVALPAAAAAQAVPTYPGDTIIARARPPQPVYAAPGPIAPTLPGDTLLGRDLGPQAAVPRHPIAPTMPGDVITQPPLWVLDTLHADSVRQGLIPPDSAMRGDSLARPGDPAARPEMQMLPDARQRADSLRLEPAPQPRGTQERPRRSRRGDGVRSS